MNASPQQTGPAPAEVWSTGDYADVCDRMIPGLGARLVELADVQAGDEVLDVATGSGNAALPAARAGATVTALDITPTLLEIGSRRASAARLEVDWVLGDAQALPFADANFDRVLSCVGVQFCADHEAAASELVRVCRPGGRIALIAWTREGFIGQVLAAVATATRGAASGRSPLDWGSEASVTDLFAARVTTSNCTASTWICPPNRPATGLTTWPRRMDRWPGHGPRLRRAGNGSPCAQDSVRSPAPTTLATVARLRPAPST